MENDTQQRQLDRIEKTLEATNKNVEILVTAVHGDQRRGAKGLMNRTEVLEAQLERLHEAITTMDQSRRDDRRECRDELTRALAAERLAFDDKLKIRDEEIGALKAQYNNAKQRLIGYALGSAGGGVVLAEILKAIFFPGG